MTKPEIREETNLISYLLHTNMNLLRIFLSENKSFYFLNKRGIILSRMMSFSETSKRVIFYHLGPSLVDADNRRP